MALPAFSGAQVPLTLRFRDTGLEDLYQKAAGAESLNGFRAIGLASGVVWALAAFLVPVATNVAPAFMLTVGLAMSLISFGVVSLSDWATTLDRQHGLVSLLTSANGIVIVALALIADALPGYAVAAIMLLFAWGFVSRTRFVYAAVRSAVVGIAFFVAIVLYRGPASLVLDILFFAAAVIGTLLALRILERNRRQLFFQELVIRAQSEQLEAEGAKSERLILNILPASIARRLRDGETTIIADDYPAVSILFGDIVGFTPLSAKLSAHQLIELLSGLFSRFDDLVTEHGLEKIKTIGDNYMAVGGLSGEADHAAKVVGLGLAMVEEAKRHEAAGQKLELRVGIHSGPVAGGVIGTRKLAFDVWGDTVNVASRLQELGPPGRVHLSAATWLLVLDQFDCEPLGDNQLRGHSHMLTYAVVGSAAGRAS